MLKIAVCDDDRYLCSELENMILKYAKKSIIQIEIEVFYMGEELIHCMQNGHSFDLIFLDIELKTTTGIEIGHKIRNELDDYISKIVFVTSTSGYEEQLFDIHPLNFIRKPIDQMKLERCIIISIKLLDIDNSTFVYKKGFKTLRIPIKDIIFFEKTNKKIKIVTHHEEDYFYGVLKNIAKKLPEIFIEPHSSFVINFNKVEYVTKDTIFMCNGHQIPISQRNLKNIRDVIINFEREKRNAKL